jgi:hypothetical protein
VRITAPSARYLPHRRQGLRFDLTDTVPHPLALVFAAQRDLLPDAVRSLEEVERVELRSQTKRADGTIEQVHLWTGSPKVLPVLFRAVIPAHLLQWRQRTVWNSEDHTGTWEIEVPGLGRAVAASGVNRYTAVPAGKGVPESTRCEVAGEFWFRPDQLDGLQHVPASAIPMVEKVVVSLVVPLVGKTAAAVSRFLTESQRR